MGGAFDGENVALTEVHTPSLTLLHFHSLSTETVSSAASLAQDYILGPLLFLVYINIIMFYNLLFRSRTRNQWSELF